MVSKPHCLILMIASQLVVNGCSRADVAGILGHNVILQFRFNTSVTDRSHFAVYFLDNKKAEHCPWEGCSRERGFEVYAKNSSIFCHITNLTQGHSGTYRGTLFHKNGPVEESNTVHLIIQEEKINNTVSHAQENRKTTKYPPKYFSSAIIAVLVVLPVVLLATSLSWFFWCRVRVRGNKAQQNSPAATQVDSVASNNMQEGAFAYSVLDFPKREVTLLDSKPNDTEYVRVHHHPHQK
ncbi:uncharacterized protein LOC133405840 [Phycodurus eques]|uniref:uncharacterized protein LOC133405840 n=1 Tax=Phycodurus eques TaxID=693459 RepID=UPI002ACD3717|nr:uncharacterized protein LOC133405840 [Phycodurus eques]